MSYEDKLRAYLKAERDRRRALKAKLQKLSDEKLIDRYTQAWSMLGWVAYGPKAQDVVDRRLERVDAIRLEMLIRMRRSEKGPKP